MKRLILSFLLGGVLVGCRATPTQLTAYGQFLEATVQAAQKAGVQIEAEASGSNQWEFGEKAVVVIGPQGQWRIKVTVHPQEVE